MCLHQTLDIAANVPSRTPPLVIQLKVVQSGQPAGSTLQARSCEYGQKYKRLFDEQSQLRYAQIKSSDSDSKTAQ